MRTRQGDRCPACGGPWSVMAADYDHAITCPTQTERRAEVERLRAAGYGKSPAPRGTEPEGSAGQGLRRAASEVDAVSPSPSGAGVVDAGGPMYRGRLITELEDEIEAGREAMNRRLMG